MNPLSGIAPSRGEVFAAIKRAVQDFYRGFDLKSVLSNTQDSDRQFFFEGPDALLWGKVVYEPLTLAGLIDLHADMENLFQILDEKILVYIFSPSLVPEACQYLTVHLELFSRYNTRFFQYDSSSFPQHSMVFREWQGRQQSQPPGPEAKDSSYKVPRDLDRIPAPWSKPVCLDRKELAELVQLGMELRPMAFR